ncbi:LLM class flavin-dependent oxidoreductase [Patulibacter sp. NPDC049589]|uniref:LLM class flavin-dependent oxidoreductase n=1 Tax=Patulibacter sp. NPDC049589 TaxID=3154731 RepID=UPI0034151BD3
MTPRRQLHLGYNVLGDGMHPAAWRAPYTNPVGALDPDQWTHVARVAERGTLDAIFLADSPSLMGGAEGGPGLPFEPTVLLSHLAAVTERIGLVGTVSTSFDQPYNVARRFASLDHLSRGRAGWNVVTSTDASAAANFGSAAHGARDERYARAEEFVDVVNALWDTWDDDAIVADQAGGRFADGGRVRPIDHHGRHFDVAGPLNVPRTPQGRPVVLQAGGSPAGLELAARTADAVFAAQASLEDALAYTTDLRRRTVRHGRPADSIRVLPGLSFVLGGTEEEARRRNDELNEIAGEDRLGTLAWQLGIDVTELSWEAPLPDWLLDTTELSTAGSQGSREIVLNLARRDRSLTARQLLERVITWHRLVVGSPEQLADAIETWFVAGAVDGFNLMPDVNPSGLEAFVEHVVPILRRRGIFRHEYEGTTLRDHLGLARPTSARRVARTAAAA